MPASVFAEGAARAPPQGAADVVFVCESANPFSRRRSFAASSSANASKRAELARRRGLDASAASSVRACKTAILLDAPRSAAEPSHAILSA